EPLFQFGGHGEWVECHPICIDLRQSLNGYVISEIDIPLLIQHVPMKNPGVFYDTAMHIRQFRIWRIQMSLEIESEFIGGCISAFDAPRLGHRRQTETGHRRKNEQKFNGSHCCPPTLLGSS